MENKKPFDWGDAVLSIALVLIGFIMIGIAKENWFIGLGVLLMINGAIHSEKNRRRNDDDTLPKN